MSASAASRDSSLKPTTLPHVKLIKMRISSAFFSVYSSVCYFLFIVNSIYFSSTFA